MKQKTLFVGLLTRKKFHFIDKCTHKHEQKDLLRHALCILSARQCCFMARKPARTSVYMSHLKHLILSRHKNIT